MKQKTLIKERRLKKHLAEQIKAERGEQLLEVHKANDARTIKKLVPHPTVKNCWIMKEILI